MARAVAEGAFTWSGIARYSDNTALRVSVLDQLEVDNEWGLGQVGQRQQGSFADTSNCILLLEALCKGNMGDVLQHISMKHLLSSVAPPDQCFYYARHRSDYCSKALRIDDFLDADRSKLINLSSTTAWKVNRFKAFVIGGGGLYDEEQLPYFQERFAKDVTAPIVVMGVDANHRAKHDGKLLQKAAFVSGRDIRSVQRLAHVLSNVASPTVMPGDVRLMRDPVLSDKEFTDTTGACWTQSSGDYEQPLCFVLPAATTADTVDMHRHLRSRVVRQGDRFVNVLQNHREGLEQFEYPGTVEDISDPMEFVTQLCSCKAIISARVQAAILGLHMGVPTFGASHLASENKVSDLMIDTMSLPDQFFLVDANFTREAVERQVDTVRQSYDDDDRRRGAIHSKLSVFHEEFKAEARRMLDVVGIAHQQPDQPAHPQQLPGDEEMKQPRNEEDDTAAGKPHVQGGDHADEGIATAAIAVGDAPALSRPSPLPSSWRNRTKDGHGPTVAVLLLFAIAGLSLLPPTGGRRGRGGHHQGRSEGGTVNTKLSYLLFALNFVLWIALAVAFSSYSKSYLRDTHDPVGLLALQGMSGSVVMFVVGRWAPGASDSPDPSDASKKTHGLRRLQAEVIMASPREMLVAILHSGQAFLTSFSLFVGGVAFTNALKAMEPVAAALFSYLLLGKRVTPGGMAALAITMSGILLLTSRGTGGGGSKGSGEATDAAGGDHQSNSRIMVSAAFTMAAVTCNALRNVVIKKGEPIPPHRTLFTCSVAAGVIGVTFMLARAIVRRMDELLLEAVHNAPQYGVWMSVDGVKSALCFVGYNFASFNLLAHLSPVGHAVGNSVKRVVMFGSGIVLMGEVMTARQLAGAGVALLGVGVYNVAGKQKR